MVNQPKKNSKARLCFHIRRHSGANAKLLTADTSTLRAVSASIDVQFCFDQEISNGFFKIILFKKYSPPGCNVFAVPIQIFLENGIRSKYALVLIKTCVTGNLRRMYLHAHRTHVTGKSLKRIKIKQI